MTTPLQTAALAVIDKWVHSHPLKELTILELRKALDAELQQSVDQVLYQRRMKADWGFQWTAWDDCSEATFKDVLTVPNLHGWTHQARALYLHPPQQATAPINDFDLRGVLASNLLCWKRLTEAEAQDLVCFFEATQLTGSGNASAGTTKKSKEKLAAGCATKPTLPPKLWPLL